MFAASQRSKNIIKEYFGEALYMRRNSALKVPAVADEGITSLRRRVEASFKLATVGA